MKILLYFLFFSLSLQTFSQDTIVVQIAHGSKPRRQFKDEFKTIGGKKGGHVVIQIDNFVYGFYFTGHRIHIFPHRKTKNGTFQKQSLSEWTSITKDKKVTKIFIPVTAEEKQTLLTFYKDNIIKPTYDYSFFGQRCASSVYNLLKTTHKIKGGGRFCNAFYPGQLRKKIIRQSKGLGYTVTVKAGSLTRVWEGD
jgi:hypothetical protein